MQSSPFLFFNFFCFFVFFPSHMTCFLIIMWYKSKSLYFKKSNSGLLFLCWFIAVSRHYSISMHSVYSLFALSSMNISKKRYLGFVKWRFKCFCSASWNFFKWTLFCKNQFHSRVYKILRVILFFVVNDNKAGVLLLMTRWKPFYLIWYLI